MTKVLDEMRRLFGEGTVAGLPDAQLLERFVAQGDGEAFAAIVARHGAVVWSACRAALGPGDRAGAEDAFQATFLVLVRRAGSFPVRGSLAGWLYRVARRVARQARIEQARRRWREGIAASRVPIATEPHDPGREECRRLIYQELERLPERYRTPLLLCDLYGLTRAEAAEAIGCPPGTVAGRLARARERLRGRLARRGVMPSVWLAAALGIDDGSQPGADAVRAAIAAGRGEGLSATAARLAARVARGLLAARLLASLSIATALATGMTVAVLALRGHDESRAEPPSIRAREAARGPQRRAEEQAAIEPDDPETADVFAGRVVDGDGRPVAGARLYLVPESPLPDAAGPVRAVTAADGRFRFSARDMTFRSLDGLPARRPGRLIAAAEGYGPDWVWTWGERTRRLIPPRDEVKTAEWTLTLARDDVPIRGRLLDPDGRPLGGVSVKLESLSVPWQRDLDAYLKTVRERDVHPYEIRVDRSLSVPSGVFGVRAEALSVLPGVTADVVTDVEGRFQIVGLGRERLVRLRIQGKAVADTMIEVMTREAPVFRARHEHSRTERVIHGAAFTLGLEPGRTVRGVVRDKATGAPLADVWVGARGAALIGLETGHFSIATDAQGRFAVDGLPPDLKNLWVTAVPKPGVPNFLASASVDEEGEAVVDCPRGIPFRLTLRDEAGRPVEAEVTYATIKPNEFFEKTLGPIRGQAGSPLSRAARQADGSYLGVALPGPGAVLVETPRAAGYRPAHVDPKAFFAPGKTDWTNQELVTAYGSDDTLSLATFSGGAWVDQHDYTAIVLVNPADGSEPLELSAMVAPDRPRMVTLLDPEGEPVVGVKTSGLTYFPTDREPRLRAATFPITGLHPDRARRIIFVKEDRKLIGFLLARGDGDEPYTVRMQPWATITGRIVDEQGRPVATGDAEDLHPSGAYLATSGQYEPAVHDDPDAGILPSGPTDKQGRFRIERLVPGQSYQADIYLSPPIRQAGAAFQGLTLGPGEVRDLGDLQAMDPAKD